MNNDPFQNLGEPQTPNRGKPTKLRKRLPELYTTSHDCKNLYDNTRQTGILFSEAAFNKGRFWGSAPCETTPIYTVFRAGRITFF